jgi:S-adenosylmethionine hydrolase
MTHVTFLSDYGLDDAFVGTCHAVIARIAPAAKVIDLTHGVPRHDVRRGALVLRGALPYLPEEGVVLAVVDPEVGAERRAVAVRTGSGRLLVGPDNGLLQPAADRDGGPVEAVEIGRSAFRLEPVSATFHGRDVFAPVAAHLAAGAALADAGEPLDVGELTGLALSRPRVEGDCLVAHVLTLDAFGNAQLDATHHDLAGSSLRLGRPVAIEVGGTRRAGHFARTFADVPSGEAILYEDADRALALAVNRGSAHRSFGLEPGTEVRLGPP